VIEIQCKAICKSSGTRCRKKAILGEYCTTHYDIYKNKNKQSKGRGGKDSKKHMELSLLYNK